MPDATDAAADAAYQEGRDAGSRSDTQAQDCPYDHGDMPRRNAWLRGFGDTRPTAHPPIDADTPGSRPPLHEA